MCNPGWLSHNSTRPMDNLRPELTPKHHGQVSGRAPKRPRNPGPSLYLKPICIYIRPYPLNFPPRSPHQTPQHSLIRIPYPEILAEHIHFYHYGVYICRIYRANTVSLAPGDTCTTPSSSFPPALNISSSHPNVQCHRS